MDGIISERPLVAFHLQKKESIATRATNFAKENLRTEAPLKLTNRTNSL